MPTTTRRRPPRATPPTVPTTLALCTCCHAYLAENLLGELRCPTTWCPNHGVVAGRIEVVTGRLADVVQESTA